MIIILEIFQIYHYILLHHNHNNHKIVFIYSILLYYDYGNNFRNFPNLSLYFITS